MAEQKILVRYLRKHGDIAWGTVTLADGEEKVVVSLIRGKPYACIVSTGKDIVGWSMCRKGDTFCKKTGRILAIDNAYKQEKPHVPPCIRNELDKMIIRSQRYFKEDK